MKTQVKDSKGYVWLIVILAVALPLSLLLAVTFGSTKIPVEDVYHAMQGGLMEHWGMENPHEYDPLIGDVVFLIRLPRLVLAIFVGMALSTCGVVMQAIVQNPMADPYILGISSGATLGATLSVICGVGFKYGGVNAVGFCGFIGALLASAVVLTLANIGGRANAVKLLLAGAAVSAVCGAFTNLAIFLSHKRWALNRVSFWSMGGLGGADWETNRMIAIVVSLGVLFFWTQYRTLNMMLLGDDVAMTLGTDLHSWRILYLILTSLLVGFAVYKAGMIGFVGLVVPHIVRMLVGTDHKKVVPVAALGGGIMLLWADVLCRTLIKGTELPIGVLTSVIGAPVFIFMIIHSSKQKNP